VTTKCKVEFYTNTNDKEKLGISTMDSYLKILHKLNLKDGPTVKELAKEFNKTERSIQLYFKKLLDSGFPIYKDDKTHRYYFSYGFSLDKTMLDSDEMMLLQLSLNQFRDVSDFDKLTNKIFNKLSKANVFNPYYVKYDDIEDISKDSPLIEELENAIKNKYHIKTKCHNKPKILEPYRIVSYDGIWHLVAKDEDDQKIKTFMISRIKEIDTIEDNYSVSHDRIKELIKNTHSAWFEDGTNFTIIVKVYPQIAHYFKAKNFLQSQTIEEELSDGSLIVSFEVSHYEDADNIIKSWLPDIEVLEPLEYKEKIKQELTEYLKRLG